MKPSSMMIHHTAVSRLKNADQFKATNDYHKKKWDFKSSLGFYSGYHYEIAANGQVRQTRIDGEVSAACYQKKMNNGQCVHICLDGDFDHEDPAPEQIYALRDIMKKLCEKYEIEPERVYFHRDFAPKSCPGKRLERDFIRGLAIYQ